MSRPTIILTIPLGQWWATDEELAGMTTAELIELCKEDVIGLVDDAEWRVSWPEARLAASPNQEGERE